MITGLLAFGLYNYFSKASSDQRIYFEADTSGRLVRVDRSSIPPKSLAVFWKPEPALLLSHKLKLELSIGQVEYIKEIDKSWSSSKASLLRQMEGTTKSLSKGRNSPFSVASAQPNLDGYSEFSREYARKRDLAWSVALAVLDQRQRGMLTRIVKTSEVKK